MPIFRKDRKASASAGSSMPTTHSGPLLSPEMHKEYIYPDPQPGLGINLPAHYKISVAATGASSSNGHGNGTLDSRYVGGSVGAAGGYPSPALSQGSAFDSPNGSANGGSGTFSSASLRSAGHYTGYPTMHGELGGGAGPAGMTAAGMGCRPWKSKLERLTGEDVPLSTPSVIISRATTSNTTAGRSQSHADPIGTSSNTTASDTLYNDYAGAGASYPSTRIAHAHAPTGSLSSGSADGSTLHGGVGGGALMFQYPGTAMSGNSRYCSNGMPVHHLSSVLDTSAEEPDCPVCLEPLSHRLAGEKPHVVPQCGHALHNACFTAVYGSPDSVLAAQKRHALLSAAQHAGGTPATTGGEARQDYQMSQAPGMCGVCRRAIILGGDKKQSEKRVAKATGIMGAGGMGDMFDSTQQREDPSGSGVLMRDDKIELPQRLYHHAPGISSSRGMVVPVIRARPEYATIYRRDPTGTNTKQNVVCVISVEVPSRRPVPLPSPAPTATAVDGYGYFAHHHHQQQQQQQHLGTIPDGEDEDYGNAREMASAGGSMYISARRAPSTRSRANTIDTQDSERDRDRDRVLTTAGADPLPGVAEEGQNQHHPRQPKQTPSQNGHAADTNGKGAASGAEEEEAGFSFGATPSANEAKSDPYRAVTVDLRARILDWKGHTLEHFGPLHLYDTLNVRQDTIVREFYVYLFQEALLCVTEERKRGLSKLVAATVAVTGNEDAAKPGLKLKGRIYLRHIKRVSESSVAGEASLSIKMDDDHLDQFVLCFNTEAQATAWRHKLDELVDFIQTPEKALSVPPRPGLHPTISEQAKRVPSPGAANQDALNHGDAASIGHSRKSVGSSGAGKHTSIISGRAGSAGDAASIAESTGTRRSMRRATVRSDTNNSSSNSCRSSVVTGPRLPIVPLHQQWSASGGHDPSKEPPEILPHAPLDLVIMISVPVVVEAQRSSTASISSSAALKLRLIRSSLEFIVNNVGPTDRVSLVSYTAGQEGQVRKTPLLQPAKDASRLCLLRFIEGMGTAGDGVDGSSADPFVADLSGLGGGSDRVDTVTAINVGLDIVLQRTVKNPTTGMVLVNDTASGPKRNQMDLVMARAEAANVPIHCFGYGKNHDPSSLWLISNHTRGSYTYIREWYQLRECLAGCIGSLMSVALTEVKVHVSLPADNRFYVRKVSGVIGSIVSANGKDVDIELGYLYFGDVREIFVELSVDFHELLAYVVPQRVLAASAAAATKKGIASRSGRTLDGASAMDDFMQRLGIQTLSLTDADSVGNDSEVMGNSMVEEVAVLEVDAGFKDPATLQSVTHMVTSTVLTLDVDPFTPDPTAATENSASVVATLADPVSTRRRIEVMVSDLITRSLLLVSRQNHSHASRLLIETRRIVETVLASIPAPKQESQAAATAFRTARDHISRMGGPRRQREMLHAQTLESFHAIIDDLDTLIDSLERNKSGFERDTRNLGAQQAICLRDQRAWTTRTNTEYLRFGTDNGSAYAALAYVHSLPSR
ncbi:hypothetical protein K437DRAFT_269762 [Tilletiaria anomala UBC 951]|uniref:RING-type domain-containing protein n=1 Tax=Tilletiaria anomala (strain ATCC 24038 / CBS 436.72 / UBC 951) TaxID=1037660 RepID=A0A066VRN2_TILAU|nr:uncharacterized protein K437DRAFT_269762 [Tilletiaria anomala UBC 951]KDN41245.1 hypothetical protein K437DRAFT_269762 [Tilletiaria anomala UBC 951]